jgi:hypothetical protein
MERYTSYIIKKWNKQVKVCRNGTMPVILIHGRWRQKDSKFKVSLAYIVRPYLNVPSLGGEKKS